MDKQEELILLSTIKTALDKRLSVLKDEVKTELMELEEVYGADRISLKIGEEKFGYVNFSRTKETVELNPSMPEAIYELDDRGLAELTPVKGWEKNFTPLPGGYVVDNEGQVCDWLVVKSSYIKSTNVKVDHEKVLPHLMNDCLAEGTVRYLLMGGDK